MIVLFSVGHALKDAWDEASASGLIRTTVTPSQIELDSGVDVGTGADGDITISANTNINTVNNISARTCADGGDAVNYSVTAI